MHRAASYSVQWRKGTHTPNWRSIWSHTTCRKQHACVCDVCRLHRGRCRQWRGGGWWCHQCFCCAEPRDDMMASTTLTAEARQSYNWVSGNSDKSLAAITTAMTSNTFIYFLWRQPMQHSRDFQGNRQKSMRGRGWEDITKAKPTANPWAQQRLWW